MAQKGSCHCKATQFEVNEPPAKLTRATRFVLRQARRALGLLHA
jgi:hypothetical protein